MLEIGMVGLGSSHPETFADVFADGRDATVTAVWDSGDVRDADYVQSFCDAYGARVYGDLTEMATAVDAAMIEAVNWDTHVQLARPFMEAGLPTFVEKPLVGCLADLETLDTLGRDVPLFGGSAVPFHPDLDGYPRGGAGRTIAAAGYNDPFYYGVHIIETVRTLIGADWRAVEALDGPGSVVAVQFAADANATIRLEGPIGDSAFAVLDVGDATRAAPLEMREGKRDAMYGRFMDAWLEVVRGERDEADRLLDSAHLQLAIQAALATGDRIEPADPAIHDVHEDGAAFLEAYRS